MEMMRGQQCAAVHTAFNAWRNALNATPAARPGITQGCANAAQALIQACGE